MIETIPRLMLAGTGSGCGKTTVTCAVLQALCNRGLRVGAFKCGPDYIDPMFHSRIIGARSANLDLFLFGPETLRSLMAEHGADRDVSVVEGVMGYYDGLGLTSSEASSHAVAQVTETPAVLVVNARGAALSVLAVIGGFLDFCPASGIRGVILNCCSPMTYPALAKAVIERFGDRIRPLGYLPKLPDCSLESRHLGLITADEVADLREKLRILAAQAEKSLDLDGLLALAQEAPPLEAEKPEFIKGPPVRIAVARDRAFCFTYEDSLNVLREMGAELVEFSPLTDPKLPEKISGLYLCGGYPELYAAELSGNRSMCESVRQAVQSGLPCIAECGGFLYLTEKIGDFPMAGALPGSAFDTGKLCRFGYVNLTARTDNLLCKAGESIPAHEFHRWDCTDPGAAFDAEKPSGKRWQAAVATETLYAGFPHFHFRSNPAFAETYLAACRKETPHD